MPLSIESAEADSLARQLTAITGESLTQAVVESLRERLARQQRPSRHIKAGTALGQIAAKYAHLPVLDGRTPDEILGYDENGLPT